MPRNPNLTPVVITDVNGKTTTVHRKPVSGASQKSHIPGPSAPAAVDYTAAGKKAFRDLPIDGTHSETAVKTLSYLMQHAPEIVDEIVARCKIEGREKEFWVMQLSYFAVPVYAEHPMSDPIHVALYQRFLELVPAAARIVDLTQPYTKGHYPVAHLVERATLFTGRLTEPDWDAVRAIMVSLEVTDNTGDLEDLAYVSQNMDKVMSVLPELHRRKSIDRNLVADLTEAFSVVREGML